jgi:hypothetical protein
MIECQECGWWYPGGFGLEPGCTITECPQDPKVIQAHQEASMSRNYKAEVLGYIRRPYKQRRTSCQ